MNSKDKQILKDSALAIADSIVAGVDGTFQTKTQLPIAPFLSVWGMCKALFGAAMKLRQEKALEWVQMVEKNPDMFTQEVMSNEKFQDGFAYALEIYLTERNEKKRKRMRNIFLGFAKASDYENFPLEKFTHTLSQLGEVDIKVLRMVNVDEQGKNYQIAPINSSAVPVESVFNLIKEGILLDTTGNRIGYPQDAPFVKMSTYGKKFIESILE